MTRKAIASTEPAELSETAADQVRGGVVSTESLLVSTVKDDRPKPTETGFIPSAGSSRMD